MSTTALFVEILIIGLEAIVWIGLSLSLVWDPRLFLNMLMEYKAYSPLLTIFLMAFAYVIGIFIDRVADNGYKLFRHRGDGALPAQVGKMRLRIMHESEGMAKFLDYQRSRLRIARATCLNVSITVLVAAVWLIHYRVATPLAPIAVIGVGVLALVLSFTATRRIDKAQIERLVQAYEIITGNRKNRMSRQIVAAVCYRWKDNEIEFLLVRTKGGKQWTFPKGHVKREPPEQPQCAAKREAGEEAGADGSIEDEPFTQYAYSKGKNARADVVAAFLMRVESVRTPEEPHRDPTWYAPEAAVKILSTGPREKRFASEHQRVIEEAMIQLKGRAPSGK